MLCSSAGRTGCSGLTGLHPHTLPPAVALKGLVKPVGARPHCLGRPSNKVSSLSAAASPHCAWCHIAPGSSYDTWPPRLSACRRPPAAENHSISLQWCALPAGSRHVDCLQHAGHSTARCQGSCGGMPPATRANSNARLAGRCPPPAARAPDLTGILWCSCWHQCTQAVRPSWLAELPVYTDWCWTAKTSWLLRHPGCKLHLLLQPPH